jgi:hypothetical protein
LFWAGQREARCLCALRGGFESEGTPSLRLPAVAQSRDATESPTCGPLRGLPRAPRARAPSYTSSLASTLSQSAVQPEAD